jgi:hypothetical protein
MEVRRYTPEEEKRWNDFVRTSKNGFFMFDRGYMDYHSDRFTDHSLMVFDENGKLFAVLPANISEDGKTLYSHQGLTFGGFIYGKSMRTPKMLAVFEQTKSFAADIGIEKIIYKAIPFFHHRQPAQEDIYALSRHGAACYRTDVSSTINYGTQTYAFSSSRKSGLKKARESNLEIRTSEDFEGFFAMMNAVLDEKYDTSATHSAAEMSLLHERFPKNITLHTCFEGEEMVAGIVIYETDLVAHTQYIASSARGKETGATDLLLDHLINSVYKGKNYFDFGISTEQGGTYLNEALIDQKEGTGARATVHQFYEWKINGHG